METEILRLLMSTLCGALVGIERQLHHKNAGLKTNTLVAIGATAFGLIALKGFGPGSNGAQIASGVVTGIGFIGAGVIMHQGATVQGINSAATLWATAAMGLALGQGSYSLGLAILLLILPSQWLLTWATQALNRRWVSRPFAARYRLIIKCASESRERVRLAWSTFLETADCLAPSLSETTGSTVADFEAVVTFPNNGMRQLNELNARVGEIDGITQINWSRIDEP